MNSHRCTKICVQTDQPFPQGTHSFMEGREKWTFITQHAQWGGRCVENEEGWWGSTQEGRLKGGDSAKTSVELRAKPRLERHGRGAGDWVVNQITRVRRSHMFRGMRSGAVPYSHPVHPKNTASINHGSKRVRPGVARNEVGHTRRGQV